MVRLKKSHKEQIIEHSRREYPQEACGILAGKEGRVEKVYPMSNTDHSATTYLMDPQEQFKVIKEMRQKELELVGIYHSHPASPPYPSSRDTDLAFYPEAFYLIISLQDWKKPEIRAFQIREKKMEEIEIKEDS